MNRIQGIAVLLFFTVAVWGQAPAPSSQGAGNGGSAAPGVGAPASGAAASPATAASAGTSISGCMTETFGNFSVNDPATSKSTAVKGAGNDLWKFQNHVVKIQGVEDPKTSIVYAKTVQDTGAACGNGALAANGAGNTAAPAGTQPTGQTTAASPGAAIGTQPAGEAASSQSAPVGGSQQPGGGVSQNSAAAPQPATSQPAASPSSTPSSTPQGTTPQATTPQASTGAAAPAAAPNATEQKGTPEAGSPQGATTSNPALPQSDETNAVFTGCLTGSVNNYQFKANGKVYRLQGNTTSLPQLLNHQVELTGEDFNGKAIQVNGARDLGGSCKGK